MRTRTLLLTLVLSCLTAHALAETPLSNAPLSEKIPARSALYAGWSGKSLVFNGSMLGQLLDEPALGKIFAQIKQACENDIPDGKKKEAFVHSWALSNILWQKPAALAVVDLPKENSPFPTAVVIVDLGGKADAFEKHLDAILTLGEDKLPVKQRVIAGISMRYIEVIPGVEIHFGIQEAYLIIATNANLAEEMLRLKAEDSLAKSDKFVKAIKDVSKDNILSAVYVDVTNIITAGKKAATMFISSEEQLKEFDQIMKALGLDKTTTIASVTSIVERGILSKSKIFTPGPHQGIFMPFTGPVLKDADIAHIPDDAIYLYATKLSLGALLDEAKRVVSLLPENEDLPNAEDIAKLDQAFAKFEKRMGVSFRKDLLDNLGDTWVLASAPSWGGFLTGTLASVSVKDEEKLQLAIDKLLVKAKDAAKEDFDTEIIIETVQADRATIKYIAMPKRDFMFIAPAWSIYKGRLYVAAYPQVIQSAIDNAVTAKPLVEKAEFRKIRSKLAGDVTAISYIDTPQIVRQVYGLVMIGWTLGANSGAAETPIPMKPDWLPALSKIEKYLWPGISAISYDSEGIIFESYSSLPQSDGMCSTAWLQLAASAAMPAAAKAISYAQRAAALNNLKGISSAFAMYSAMHDDEKYPRSLADLVADDELITCKYFITPASGKKPPTIKDGKFVGEIDFVYTLAGKDITAADIDHDDIIVYERIENYDGKGTNVLYGDGTVGWLSAERFQRAIAKGQK